ncbi:selenocysteine-specific translation elongation factor [Actinopolymorpha singaporensis]|uniref:Selenocysteine-specific translation elongation factor SelB n=1 Tax=Actinopolymorpha singaporensis TaxID=117157 RepID=A0A1H1M022_9ACTN|nr:selenocysteine-specific translation elongation factor [Actinopolymorpha singaporensis]SDR80184.1 selenocysteine-specific translation elongation factor SelB [Actinopolymorpha singaporensis]
MYVVATAGHVDHGKSTLVRRLTGMEPDRWAEERRRGLTIDLGFAWTRLPDGQALAFVDVPGHERFVPNMLAGAGPVAAAMFVVAADEGWRAQSAEHLAALDALGVRHGLLVVTRSDLADPEPARAHALEQLAASTLGAGGAGGTGGAVPSVAVSGRTGAGLDDLLTELAALTHRLPVPDPGADVRLWVDRSFSVRGAGTVVTGTLTAGTIAVGDILAVAGRGGGQGERRLVRVRGLQALGEDLRSVQGTARVAVNLRGVDRADLGRGDALVTPDAWRETEVVDVALRYGGGELPGTLVLHVGAAAVPARVRPLGPNAARLTLDRPLPLRTGDRGLLRDPGRHQVAAGLAVLDAAPPELHRRGAARTRARSLAPAVRETNGATDPADSAGLTAYVAGLHLREHGLVRRDELRALGLPELPPDSLDVGAGWSAAADHWAKLTGRAPEELAGWEREHPLAAGMPSDVLRQRLGIPAALLPAVAGAAELLLRDGQVRRPGTEATLPPAVEKAVRTVEDDLAAEPFAAPEAARLAELGLGTRELAAAVRAGRLLRVTDTVVLLPDAPDQARRTLGALDQPFTLSQARIALGTTRRVAVPLLELLDERGVTERLPDSSRRLVPRASTSEGR